MKKNKFLKIAGAIFTMCLMTTCAIGTTFAKYTTGSSAADTARVAKWGVEVSTSGTLFGKQYKDVIVAETDGTITVKSSDKVKVVAPGTKNEVGMKISIKGQPEVDYTVTASYGADFEEVYLNAGKYAVMVAEYGVNEGTLDWTNIYEYNSGSGTFTVATSYTAGRKYFRATNILNLTQDYYPIAWSVERVNNSTTSTVVDNKGLEVALNAMVNGIGNNATYDANTSIDKGYILTWAWAFEGNDKADTILGNIMAGNTETQYVVVDTGAGYMTNLAGQYNLEVGCSLEIGATQVD